MGDKIIEFLDDNRAQDIARVEVMQRNLENDARFTQVESEAQAKINHSQNNLMLKLNC